MNVSYWNEFTVSLYDGGVLDVKDSILDCGTQTQVLLEVLGEMSTLRMLNTTCYLAINSRSHGIIIIDSSEINGQVFWHSCACSRISVIDSSVQSELSISFPGKFGGTVNVTGLKTGQLEDVDIEVPGDGFLKISNSSVRSWIINWEPISSFEECHLIVGNSTLLGVWLTFYEGSEVKIRDLKGGFFLYWNLHEEAELKNVKTT